MDILNYFRPFFYFASIFAATSLIFSGCASNEINTATAEGAFKLAEKFEKDERFEEAMAQFSEVKNKYPYSSLAIQSELRIADLQFRKEAYIESESAYRTFKDLHPEHPKIDYVTYRIALSLFNQTPPTVDRDLEMAEKSILYFEQVVNSYPNSSLVKEAKDKKAEILSKLADKEIYIGDFYFKRDQYDSALGRYQLLLKKFPNSKQEPYVLYRAGLCSLKLDDKTSAREFAEILLQKHPGSKEAQLAKKDLLPKAQSKSR